MNHSDDDLIRPITPPPHSTVVVAGTTITMQQLQQIYSELTGKAESLNNYYDDPIRLSFDDVEVLHHRIIQTWEQYRVVSSTVVFTIYYLRNTKDQFTSFERFKLQSSASGDPIESVLLKYDILLVLPNVSKPQSYSISVRIVSRLALEKRMREGSPFVSLPRFLRIMGQHTGSVEITYIDYSVARAFMAGIDEWFSTIPRSPDNKFMKWLQPRSHWIPRIARLVTVIVVMLLITSISPHFIDGDGSNFLQFGRFFLWSSLGVYVAYMLASWFGMYAEHAVDEWSAVSYIDFNRGDKIEIAKSEKENRNHLIRAACGVAANILVTVVAKLIAAIVVASQ